jgi:lipopolysaccharide/colanic/teichoic acid biosynthesis glycosyltransferase
MAHTFYLNSGKRALDAAASLLGLLLVSPVLLIVALIIKCTSRGPVFYRQQRVGLHGRTFSIVKFRTMRSDAEQLGPSLTAAHDPRVTAVGRRLRRLKLDELPQLWNVLIGEMSLVGPRPEVPQYVAFYSPAERRVLTVRPGMTDLASIAYRNEEELLARDADPDRHYREVVLPDKLRLNLEYLDRISLTFDLLLLVRTAKAVFTFPAPETRRVRTAG